MFHRPNFCCSCGEKIDRIEWHIWTSRRHCEFCETEHRADEWLPRVLAAFIILLGLFGAGSLIRANREVPDLVHSPVEMARQRAAAKPAEPVGTVEPLRNPVREEPPRMVNDDEARAGKASASASPAEKHYYCGAATKKGAPCTRKVKGGGRCWQHQGREAILPESDLEIRLEGKD